MLSLERIRFGSLVLPSDLKPGKWRDLTHSEVAKLKKEIGHVIKEQQVVV